jgi:hypothetical protein
LRRVEGGAKISGYFLWKIAILPQKIIYCAPPWICPCSIYNISIFLFSFVFIVTFSNFSARLWLHSHYVYHTYCGKKDRIIIMNRLVKHQVLGRCLKTETHPRWVPETWTKRSVVLGLWWKVNERNHAATLQTPTIFMNIRHEVILL